MRIRSGLLLSACLFALPLATVAQAPAPMAYVAAASAKFTNHPALPACATISVADGDPGKGPSIITLKIKAGCVLAWHWHTPNERLIIISGSAHATMKGMKATELHPGDFMLMPSKGIHQFHAVTDVVLDDISDAPFDMHYVDASGKEITPEVALETAAH